MARVCLIILFFKEKELTAPPTQMKNIVEKPKLAGENSGNHEKTGKSYLIRKAINQIWENTFP